METKSEGASSPDSSINEQEKKSPVFFIYRDNDLFRSQVPLIEEYLKSERDVSSRIFEQGTDLEVIRKWIEENQDIFLGKIVMLDRTVERQLSSIKPIQEWDIKNRIDLDDLLTDAAGRAFFGKDNLWEEDKFWIRSRRVIEEEKSPQERLEESRSWFMEIIKKILKGHSPKLVLIVIDKVADHSEVFDFGQRQKFESIRSTKDERRKADLIAANKFKEWLIESGINSETIMLVSEEDFTADASQELISKADNLDSWVILDRHIKPNLKINFTKAKVLRLPEGNFVADAIGQNLLKIEPGILSEGIRKVLEEKLNADY